MSGTIGQTEYGLLNELLANSATVRQRLNRLTQQVGSGSIADTYAGLGAGASVSLNLRPQIAALQTQQKNIDAATARLGVTQTSMTQLQNIASGLLANLNNLNGLNPGELDSIAANARAALAQTANLLNARDGNGYVFAGEDTQNPPIPNPDGIGSSPFVAQIATAVAGLSANGAAATAASTLSVAGSNAIGTAPFSNYLSQPAVSIQQPALQVAGGQIDRVGLLASANSAVASTGSSTTGSYMRDLMRALATIGALTGPQVNDPAFSALVQDTRTSLTGAVSAMAADTGVLGDTQASLTTMQTGLSQTQTVLTAQAGGAEDVDMAATLSALTQTQTQLQASYQLIASLGALSLAKYLPGG
ncbi:MAG: flagellin [Rhodospirillales bacterium]